VEMDVGRSWRWMRAGRGDGRGQVFSSSDIHHSTTPTHSSQYSKHCPHYELLFLYLVVCNVFTGECFFYVGSSQLVLILWTFWKIVPVLSTSTMKHLTQVSVG
jgi:hypothetical protein